MTAIISASCIFPSGPTLPLADIANRLQFSLVRKHPLYVDRCGAQVKASYFPEIVYAQPEERFRQLTRQVLVQLLNRQPELKLQTQLRIWVLLPPLNRPGMASSVVSAVTETVQENIGQDTCDIQIRHGGPAEFATVLETFVAGEEQKGRVDILLAVDSWLPAPSLMWLDEQNLLHNALRQFRGDMRPNPYGRIPSEGAAAVVLASGVPDNAWCVIRGAGSSDENVLYSDEGVCLGKGLIRAAQKAVSFAGNTLLESVVSDVNGEPYRADELGFTLLKLSNNFTEDYVREVPALASGDLGCAGLLAHLALVAWQMCSTIRTGNVMVLSSSDDKRRGAVVLSAVQGG